MKKLKNKVFFTILIILTSFLISILVISNYQDYKQERLMVITNLNRMFNNMGGTKNSPNNMDVSGGPRPKPNFEHFLENKKFFMDAVVYTVMLDGNNIIGIVSHNDNQNDNNIESLALKIIKNNNKSKRYIGNLYFEKYSYSYVKGAYITIIDNSNSNDRLQNSLFSSFIIFSLLEIIIVICSNLLTKWIIKPVEDSFNKQKQFIADASHELKTPLSVIMASSEALEENPKEKKWLENIQNESERMNKLISNLLYLTTVEKVDNKEYEINNLSKVIEKSVLTFESLIYEKHITLDYDIKENINLKCDLEEIKQLIAILLDNAIKHSVEDGDIFVNLTKVKDEIILEVKNKGDVIPKGEEEKIFERFYRIDKARNRKENRYGLGLAIAKSIVENHKGTISANSNNGYTTFKVVFKKK